MITCLSVNNNSSCDHGYRSQMSSLVMCEKHPVIICIKVDTSEKLSLKEQGKTINRTQWQDEGKLKLSTCSAELRYISVIFLYLLSP